MSLAIFLQFFLRCSCRGSSPVAGRLGPQKRRRDDPQASALVQRSIQRRQKSYPVVPIGKSQAAAAAGRHAPSSRVGATGPHRGSALDRENRRAERSRGVATDRRRLTGHSTPQQNADATALAVRAAATSKSIYDNVAAARRTEKAQALASKPLRAGPVAAQPVGAEP